MNKEPNLHETIIIHPETGRLMYWNSWFQKYFSNDGKISVTYLEYSNLYKRDMLIF